MPTIKTALIIIITIIIIIPILDLQTLYQKVFDENAPEIFLLGAAQTEEGREEWGNRVSLKC